MVSAEEVKEIIENVRKEKHEEKDILINVLHEIQKHFNNFIPPEAVEIVARECKVPLSQVYEVLTFYTMFSMKPRGKYVIRVCTSLPCHVTGGKEIVETLKEILKIDFGETTKDGLFTLEKTSCLGLCGVSPVIMINEDFHGNLTPEKVKEIIEKIMKKERGEDK